MKSTNRSISRLAGMLVILAIILASTVLMSGQESQRTKGVPWDWTHHHVVFSRPGSVIGASDAARLKIASDPRYIMQQQERGAKGAGATVDDATRAVSAAEPAGRAGEQSDTSAHDAGGKMSIEDRNAQAALRGVPSGLMRAIIPPPGGPVLPEQEAADSPLTKHRMHKDWSETLGPSGTAGAAGGTTGLGEFPATFTTGTSCTDFAIYNNGLAGSTSQANIIAYDNLYSTCDSGVPTAYWAYNTGTLGVQSATISNSVVLSMDGTQVAFVQFVPYATLASGTLTANAGFIPTAGYTITVGTTTYTWETTTSITTVNQMSTFGIGTEGEIAQTIYAALTGSRANCPSTNTTCISASQTANSSVTATVSGEIVTVFASCGYGTCGNTVVFTQEGGGNTDSADTGVSISPTSGDLSGGSGTVGVGGAQLVVLKWAPGGTLTSPTNLVSNSSYPNCTAPCMIAVPFRFSQTDTYSSPFVAYGANGGPSTIYVGDDVGILHQFANIFSTGTPSEVTTGGWPVTLNANASLGSPVYDTVSGLVFVGDYIPYSSSENCQLFAETDPCGYLYSVNSSGTVVKSAQLDYNIGILDSPIVDPITEKVYVFVGDDGTTNCTANGLAGPCAGVYQFSTGFTGGTSGTEAAVGTGYEFMMSGAFDNAYFTSGSPPTGNLYVVGNTGPANNTLYQIPITSGVMATANAGPVVATNYTSGYYGAGLQVSEFYNTSVGNHDYIFLSVLGFGQNNANIACPSQSVTVGCIMGFDVTSGTISSGTVSTGVLPEQGGTSGIVVDNGAAGASNIYFSTLLNQSCTTSGGTNGCAVQTIQSAP
jgi:hypothetical protein